MARPEKTRRIAYSPEKLFFKPRGIPLRDLDSVELSLDELEVIRLCYLEGLYQEQAAEIMEISRQTLGRILSSANRKIADFLVNGKTLRIGGGSFYLAEEHPHGHCHKRHHRGHRLHRRR